MFQIDLKDIAEGYQEMFDASLIEALKKETEDEYGKLLLKLINGTSNTMSKKRA